MIENIKRFDMNWKNINALIEISKNNFFSVTNVKTLRELSGVLKRGNKMKVFISFVSLTGSTSSLILSKGKTHWRWVFYIYTVTTVLDLSNISKY